MTILPNGTRTWAVVLYAVPCWPLSEPVLSRYYVLAALADCHFHSTTVSVEYG